MGAVQAAAPPLCLELKAELEMAVVVGWASTTVSMLVITRASLKRVTRTGGAGGEQRGNWLGGAG